MAFATCLIRPLLAAFHISMPIISPAFIVLSLHCFVWFISILFLFLLWFLGVGRLLCTVPLGLGLWRLLCCLPSKFCICGVFLPMLLRFERLHLLF